LQEQTTVLVGNFQYYPNYYYIELEAFLCFEILKCHKPFTMSYQFFSSLDGRSNGQVIYPSPVHQKPRILTKMTHFSLPIVLHHKWVEMYIPIIKKDLLGADIVARQEKLC